MQTAALEGAQLGDLKGIKAACGGTLEGLQQGMFRMQLTLL